MRIRRAAIEAMIAHAVAEEPLECCGLLIGGDGRIERAWPARNLRASPVAFLVSPEDHFAAIRAARSEGIWVVGAYHSHPRAPAVPSATDIRESSDPTFIHAIVSLAGTDPIVRAYLLRDDGPQELQLECRD